ncbi:MAG: ribonuclease P protein component, partial [Flavobacteriaceae bacterium]|nr:ribonuclease P protein component [Flavobacteriaceae bacterium]
MSKKLTLRRLKGKDLIDALFRKGAKIQSKNLLLKVLESPKGGEILRVGVSVPKRNFKRAVDRNHIKRQLRIVFKEVQVEVPFSGACM